MSVRVDSRGAYSAGKRFKGMASRMDKAESLAVADLQRRIVPEFVRAAQETYNINAKRVRESSGARRQGTAVELTGYDRPTGLLQYGAKETGAGVVVQVRKDGPATNLGHAFIRPGLSGNKQVFSRVAYGKGAYRRKMTKGNYKGELRTPIAAHYGPSTAQILRNQQMQERLIGFSQKRLSTEVRRQIGRL
jgi:hypothetical protein